MLTSWRLRHLMLFQLGRDCFYRTISLWRSFKISTTKDKNTAKMPSLGVTFSGGKSFNMVGHFYLFIFSPVFNPSLQRDKRWRHKHPLSITVKWFPGNCRWPDQDTLLTQSVHVVSGASCYKQGPFGKPNFFLCISGGIMSSSKKTTLSELKIEQINR